MANKRTRDDDVVEGTTEKSSMEKLCEVIVSLIEGEGQKPTSEMILNTLCRHAKLLNRGLQRAVETETRFRELEERVRNLERERGESDPDRSGTACLPCRTRDAAVRVLLSV